MTVLADFEVIENDIVVIGDPPVESPFTRSFNTGGRLTEHTNSDRKLQEFIMLNVRGINVDGTFAEVEVNGQPVGRIFSALDDIRNWRTQMIVFDAAVLMDGDNRIVIRPVPRTIDPQPGDVYDNYSIMNVICFFRQDSD